jgi:putative tricarboxylic transport membrane protein
MRVVLRTLFAAAFAASFAFPAMAEPPRPECVTPANPGGGFDLTCRLLSESFRDLGLFKRPMQVTYLPGGIGAVAYNTMVTRRADDANVVIAASTGSALNLALGKFASFDESAVRWIGAVATDFGVIVVKKDAPWQTLDELMKAVKANPQGIVFGAGGTVGSQDWMKAALLARAAGVDPRQMRYVAFEGGGPAIAALLGGHIQVFPGDAAELASQLDAGTMRVLGVLANERLTEPFADVPTAREQGYDVTWEIWRGYYAPPGVSDADYQYWVDTLSKVTTTPEFERERKAKGLFKFMRFGNDFDRYVKAQVAEFRSVSRDLGLIR